VKVALTKIAETVVLAVRKKFVFCMCAPADYRLIAMLTKYGFLEDYEA
jgi:hypothetical protein